MNKKICFALIFMVVLIAGATPASANYICSGSVNYVGLGNSGVVTVSIVGGFSYGNVCQVGATSNGWTSDACKTLYSQLLVAESTGAPLMFFFNDTINNCTQQPQWAYMTGLYFVAQQK